MFAVGLSIDEQDSIPHIPARNTPAQIDGRRNQLRRIGAAANQFHHALEGFVSIHQVIVALGERATVQIPAGLPEQADTLPQDLEATLGAKVCLGLRTRDRPHGPEECGLCRRGG